MDVYIGHMKHDTLNGHFDYLNVACCKSDTIETMFDISIDNLNTELLFHLNFKNCYTVRLFENKPLNYFVHIICMWNLTLNYPVLSQMQVAGFTREILSPPNF